MPASVQDDLDSLGYVFTAPDSPLMYSAGYGQYWPHARGVFVGKKPGIYAWVNELDHLKILSKQEGGDLKQAFERFVRAERSVSSCLKSASGCDYAWDSRRGFLNSDPASLGTAMRASVSLRIPRLGGHMRDFKAVCKRLGLQARRSSVEDGDWELSLYSLPGRSEVSQINALLAGCSELCALESRLEAGQDLTTAMQQSVEADPPASSQEANGESAQPDVPADSSEVMLDLAGRHSIAADVLRADPAIYDRLKDKQTATGVAFETCVRACFENSGHPMIKTIGAVAGDAQCYDAFKDFFDEVIKLRHPNFAGNGHSTDLDWTKVSDQPLDPDGAGRVVSVRLRLNRNLRDIPMSPACSLEERREVERAAALALSQLQGEYFPLRGSNSYAPRPGGLSIDDEERLDGEHLLFGEPDSQVLLSSGFGREWPDARGVFVGEDRRFVAWVNESDHLRIQAMQEGADLKGVFERLCSAIGTVEDSLKASGYEFSHSDPLGFLGTCPSNLGTCLAASAIIRVPLLSSRPEFRAITRKLKLHAHMGVGSGLAVADGVWEILNTERLGSTEVDQVNQVIAGCRALLQAEGRLEKGEELDSSLLD
jgi:creatine kinase